MKKIIPEKLKIGDEIRIIAPSRSLIVIKEEVILNATKKLESMGFKVTFGKNVSKSINDNYKCASVLDRVQDLHDAFEDKNVKCILSAIGGFNVNQILDYIDFDLIKNNPKIICGFSDITALTNAITAKTGLVTYSGPQFFNFGMLQGLDYTTKYFKKKFMDDKAIKIESSKYWSNDSWIKDQNNRNFIKNEGIKVINEGIGEGTIIGGNLCTLNLLKGTEYMPFYDNLILFIEEDGLIASKYYQKEFDRNLQSLLHSLGNCKIQGIVVGRSEIDSEMTFEKWNEIFSTKKELSNIPIIVDCDFGHTTPVFTFPIGGHAMINTNNNEIIFEIND